VATRDLLLVDTNVLLDLVTDDSNWGDWSVRQLEAASLQSRLIVNPIIYAELSIGFARIEEVNATLELTGIDFAQLPVPALFLAGKVFQQYRARGGGKTGVLPDFSIGAHAAILEIPLLTRDVTRYRAWFPTLSFIAPDGK
jgi:predicted nucleic acid-binding protein